MSLLHYFAAAIFLLNLILALFYWHPLMAMSSMEAQLSSLTALVQQLTAKVDTLQASVDHIGRNLGCFEFETTLEKKPGEPLGLSITSSPSHGIWVTRVGPQGAAVGSSIRLMDVIIQIGGTKVGPGQELQDDRAVKKLLGSLKGSISMHFRRPSANDVHAMKDSAAKAKLEALPQSSLSSPVSAVFSVARGMVGGAVAVAGGAVASVAGGGLGSPTVSSPKAVEEAKERAARRTQPVPSARSYIGTAYVPPELKKAQEDEALKRKQEKEAQIAKVLAEQRAAQPPPSPAAAVVISSPPPPAAKPANSALSPEPAPAASQSPNLDDILGEVDAVLSDMSAPATPVPSSLDEIEL